MSTDKSKHIEIINAGPVHRFEADLDPGMNVFVGGNEAGKSSVLDAIGLSAGEAVDVDSLVSDGQTKGYVKLDGTVLVEFTRSRTKKGEFDAALASVSSLALAINPMIKDRDRAETRRLTELLSMFDLKTTAEVIRALVASENEDLTDGAIDYLGEVLDFEELAGIDPVTASQKIKRELEKRKRELLSKASEAQGRWQANHPESKPEKLSAMTVEAADAAYREAVGNERETKGSAEQRAAREREREEIRETLGEKPDESAAETLIEETEAHLKTAQAKERELRDALTDLERQLAAHMETVKHYDLQLKEANRSAVRHAQQFDEWKRRKTILDSEITGADAKAVEMAAVGVQAARGELELARTTAEYRRRLELSEAARRERESFEALAGQYDTLATSVPGKLGGLLNQAGMPKELSVEDGVLTYRRNGKAEPFHRLSDGARTRILLPIWTKKNPGKLAAFPRVFWFDLEEESKVEVAQALEDEGVIGCTEVATRRGEGIAVEHFEVAASAASSEATKEAKKPRKVTK